MAGSFDVSAVLAQATSSYLKLPLSQKLLLPMLIAGSIWGIVMVSKWAANPDYAVLYSDLEPADAGAVIERLKTQKIKYQVRGDGGTIAVSPEAQVFLTDEGTLWLYQESERQVLVDNFKNAFVSDLPVSFLMGLGRLDRDFTAESACENGDGMVIELKPGSVKSQEGKDEGLQGLKLLVAHSSYLPKGASVTDISGNITAFLFEEIETGVALKEGQFKAEFPQGIDIIDKRKS